MDSTRRRFLKCSSAALAASITLRPTAALAQTGCRRVSGAGSYVLGPFQNADQKDQRVFLVTDLGFDERTLWCKVATNYDPFIFPTAKLGLVQLAAHEFFMDMQSTRIDSLDIKIRDDGPHAVYSGALRSETRLFSGAKAMTIVEEELLFDCDAADLGPAATTDITRTNFSMTAKFNPAKEHAAIFGETVTFAGHLTRGNITIAGMPGDFTPIVISLKLEPSTVRVGGAFAATFAGANISDGTHFDVRFRAPGSTTDQEALNWQRGASGNHTLPVGSSIGTWNITGVRAHQDEASHIGGFTSVSVALMVTQ